MRAANEKGPRLTPRPLLWLTDEISLLNSSQSTPAAVQGQQEPPR